MATTLIEPKQSHMKGLTPKQQAFVLYLLADPNFDGARAARKAGYEGPAPQAANKLLHAPKVQRAIAYAVQHMMRKLEITAERILQEIARIAFRDPVDLVDVETGFINTDRLELLPEDTRRCIEGIKARNHYDTEGNLVSQSCELRMASKIAALEMLAKYRGLFAPQKVDVRTQIDWSGMFKPQQLKFDQFGMPVKFEFVGVRKGNGEQPAEPEAGR